MKQEKNIWEQSRVELFQKLDCRETGLSQEDAAAPSGEIRSQ